MFVVQFAGMFLLGVCVAMTFVTPKIRRIMRNRYTHDH